MKIGLFGGSFNPVHNGHIKIAKYAYEQLGLDKLIFIPAATNPFKKKQKNVSAQDRIKMIELSIYDCPENFEISEYEIKKGGVSYTYQTIRYFAKKYESDELFFLIGSDCLPTLHKWEFIEEITKTAKFVVFKRSNNFNKTNIKRFNLIKLNNELYEESSTAIRKGVLSYTDPKVNAFIGQNRLFAKEIVHSTLTALRAKHSVATAEFSAKLAKANGLTYNQGYYAGLFHDICKEVPEQASREFISSFGLNGFDKSIYPRHKLHQVCGSLWVKYVYMINDQSIVDAIECHTTLKSNLTKLDKILFIADKICDGRAFSGVQKLRQLALENLEEGFKQVVIVNYEYNKSKGVVFDDEQQKIYDKWME
ncbi:nicotinate-nucleotide adenylyltransferase [Mycoplasma sp. ES3157-GEN-MYC]|uniref:Probable nicotinate-nucleotide adenylyltransferase n=1 Tax=Mycoplasma miroungigenitalium TaxID=754515 RepID=A0A6M4J904_9MOLU|nr:nicotinate-nucleotide adenylyltransferase [Mycoplasma miroungigenitalium]MBU4690313.1 nicotinate-nucleotide adenylyltransferase [Mycoplasma miroungigenitalium]MBU4691580.1 nicotinate-nucleotide adenylyltransferase [Mycoplasma miroungigenitalium]QJR43410.1 nicotinate-nucleotide adenylyltransferase [Mycoplasma miroungigenitalium]